MASNDSQLDPETLLAKDEAPTPMWLPLLGAGLLLVVLGFFAVRSAASDAQPAPAQAAAEPAANEPKKAEGATLRPGSTGRLVQAGNAPPGAPAQLPRRMNPVDTEEGARGRQLRQPIDPSLRAAPGRSPRAVAPAKRAAPPAPPPPEPPTP